MAGVDRGRAGVVSPGRYRDGVAAEGVAVGLEEGRPWAVRYTVRCDAGWRTRELTVQSLAGDGATLVLTGDGVGRWADGRGQRLAALDGCLDVDLMCTPFTNTLPIRRIGMAPGWSEELTVAYVAVPGLDVSVARQRYQCLRSGSRRRPLPVRGPGHRFHGRDHRGRRRPRSGVSGRGQTGVVALRLQHRRGP